ncbi:MerR family transcriptional regulator [Salibacterium aidingense]|uniref:MerR family transcriptional regulator n=1 Tax=Salibacterium aidingense TaxID=384933 RepID=UPI003BCAE4C1
MKEPLYSIGELAELSGTTIRAIQYYDKIDLLPAKRNKNLRYYTQDDLWTLQQIIFYKELGFPLKEMKDYLGKAKSKSDIKKVLKKQSELLFQKEMDIKMNIAIIEAIAATMDTDSKENMESMIKLALRLNKKTILGYAAATFDQETKNVFEEKYPDSKEVIEIYWHWKQLILEAAFHKINHTPYKSPSGYQFGKKWQDFIEYATDNDPEKFKAYTRGLEQSDQWPEEDLFLYNFCHDFIEQSHAYYLEQKGG